MNCCKRLLLCLTLAFSCLGFYAPEVSCDVVPARKKLIATGWDTPNAAQFRRGIKAMERFPFDGAVVRLAGLDVSGKSVSSRHSFSNSQWDQQSFEEGLADLKASRSSVLTDNFIIVTANPGDVDWFDDAGWKQIVEHWRILARIAFQGGMKGIVFDPEPYVKPHRQFCYSAQPKRDQHTYGDYRAKARERGRDVMSVLTSEFPTITILTYRLFSDCIFALETSDSEMELLDHDYGLLIPFADGWFDAIAPSVTVVDGNEDAYLYNDADSFNRAYVRLKSLAQFFVSPENRTRFRAQFQVGHGVYLDAYANPEGSTWYIDGKGETRAQRLETNVSSALKAADEYVWVNGEKGRWWLPGEGDEKPFPPWDEVIAGSAQALLNAKDPTEAARRRIPEVLSEGDVDNIILNGDFLEASDALPTHWTTWQKSDSQEPFSFDAETGFLSKGSAKMTGVKYGCFIQGVTVESGQRFLISARVKQVGNGICWLRAGWQTDDGKWLPRNLDARLSPLPEMTEDGWRHIVGQVTVPDSAGRMMILPGVSNQFSHDDQIWFDDIIVLIWQ